MYFAFTEWNFWITLILIGSIMGAVQGMCAYLILAERKISAWAQDRVGPNRAGSEFGVPFGLLQPIADGIKFLIKEQVIPGGVDRIFYLLAPCIATGTALLALAVIPVGPTTAPPVLMDYRTDEQVALSQKTLPSDERAALANTDRFRPEARGPIWPRTRTEEAMVLAAEAARARSVGEKPYAERLADYNQTMQFVIAPGVDIGLLFILAVGSMGAYAVVLGGWSSNNKYSLLGSLRSSAQLISYEIPMGMSLLGAMYLAGSLNLEQIILFQYDQGWNVLFQPVLCLIFVVSIFAECNRLPFDLSEAEQELVGGFHTEYSGMKFALFFLGEYTHMIATSFIVVAVFFGGWLLPGVTTPGWGGWGDAILKLCIYAAKMLLFVMFYMFVRWTLPRFRFDQLMGLAWKVLMPLALVNIVLIVAVSHFGLSKWLLPPLSLLTLVIATAISLQMPRPRPRSEVAWQGHPVTGQGSMVLR